MMAWSAHVDGAARGNPGPAGIGVVLCDEEGRVVKEIAEPLGIATNNEAEYRALIRALEEARAAGCRAINIFTDSELMSRQMNGEYAVKAPHLRRFFTRARELMRLFDRAQITHVPRRCNARADRLSNLGADRVSRNPSVE